MGERGGAEGRWEMTGVLFIIYLSGVASGAVLIDLLLRGRSK